MSARSAILRAQTPLRNPQLSRLDKRNVGGGATDAGKFRVFENRVDPREKFVRPMRFANESGESSGDHPVDAALGLAKKAGAQEDRDVRPESAQPPKSFFAVHERHRKIEHNQMEPMRSCSKVFQAFESGISSGELEGRCCKDALGQGASGGFVIDK